MASSANNADQKNAAVTDNSPPEVADAPVGDMSAPVYGPYLLAPDNNTVSTTDTSVACYNKDVPDSEAIRGRCGLHNLGNTCFMNSGLQCLLSSIPLVKFLFSYKITDQSVYSTLLGQFHELFGKVWSGKFSMVCPREFKQTLGLFHPQFQDYRQHDCQEFLALLLDTLHEQLNYSHQNPANQTSAMGPTFQPQPIESADVSMNNQSLNTSLGSDKTEDQSRHLTSSHSSLTFENIKHGERLSNSNEQNEGKLDGNEEKDVNSSNTVSFTPNLISEESNHSTASGYSSDSEQCSVIKNLNLRNSPIVGPSNEKLSPKSVNEDINREETLSVSTDSLKVSQQCSKDIEEVKMVSMEDEILGGMNDTLKDRSVKNKDSHDVLMEASVRSKKMNDDTVDLDIHNSDSKSELGLSTNMGSGLSANMGSDQAEQPVILNNALASKSVHSLEDIYAKETKILNTNVLAEEFLSELVTVDSDKFMKQDNTRLSTNRPEVLEEEGLLNNIMEASAKKDDAPSARPIKDVNLRADKKSKLTGAACASNKIQNVEQDDYSSNSVKRMKFEGTEKNLQMQELSKINKERLLFGTRRVNMEAEPSIDIDNDSDSDASENRDGEMEISEEEEEEEETDCGEAELVAAGNSFTTSEVVAAEAAWQKYLSKNDSIIVDTFQGQFKSTVICSVCNQVSVTFEPFMYLSVPIPHAMERQLCVIFISPKCEPTRYLLNMNKHDKILKVKQELCSLAGRQDCEIILAEVLDWHISRILEDNSMLRYVNDSSRKIYAFELEPVKLDTPDDDLQNNKTENFAVAMETCSQGNSAATDDVFSHMGSFSADSVMFDAQSSYSNYQNPSSTEDSGFGTAQTGMTFTSDLGLTSDLGMTSDPQNSDMIGTSMWNWSEPSADQEGNWNMSNSNIGQEQNWSMSNSATSDPGVSGVKVTSGVSDLGAANSGKVTESGLDDKWKSCAICLEELTDMELMVHTSCGGTFCSSCLEMSVQHYGESSYCCPVCSSPAELSEDFVPLADAASHKPKTRIVAVPVTFRYETDSFGRPNRGLFAHPSILNLPSNLTGEYIYGRLKEMMPVAGDFKVIMTDGQGLHCSRCLYMEHCSGCEIKREGEAVLRPGDHLTVCVQEVAQSDIEHAQRVTDHKSMEKRRSSDPVTLLDCFSAFTQSEDLDEHNPWFCPQCRKNQLAKKTMTVWQYPDTLIIQLKRFVFHELSGTKVDCAVQFPIDNLDLQQFISGPKTKDLQYSLYSCVCHFGGANSGHYTSYAKHPVSGQWFYYNDETVSLQSPGESDFSSTYVLFYQRKGTDKAIQIPEALELEESHVTMTSPLTNQMSSVTSHVTAVPNALEPPEEEIPLDSKQQRDTPAVEKSEASLDFYS